MSRRAFSFWLIFLPVVILLYASLKLSIYVRYDGTLSAQQSNAHYLAFSVIFAMWILVYFIHGLFEVQVFRRYSTLFFNLVSATVVNLLAAVIYFYFQPNLILTPRRFLLILVGVSFGLIFIWNLLVKYFLKNRLTEDIYLFSFNNELKELEDAVHSHNYLGYRVLGHLNEESLSLVTFSKNSSVILPDNLYANPAVSEKLYQLRTHGVKFYNHKNFYEQLLRRIYLSQINEVWFLENINYQEKRFYNLVKRIVDIVLSFLGFIVFIISFPFVALLIKLSGEGNIFFVQERVGKKGEIFKVYKYRSMQAGTKTDTWTSVNDPRITKVGKFLRKSRIDEWPQFINLLLGHMSIVGPRPEQPHIVEDLKKQIPFYDERHLVKPGLTGWAQLNIYAGTLEESKTKLQYDLYYIKNRSFLFDLEIILKTVYYIFTWQGR
jgi:exopolysaccharide biosynthesis polyprenyl glycosylphosphotransferase